MSARLRWLLGLVLGLALLDGALAWLDRREEAARAPAGGALVAFELPGVARVTLTRAGKRPVVLARTSQGPFVVASSKGFPARPGKVDQLLTRVRAWRRDRVAGDRASHDAFCVTPEKAVSVRLEDWAGATLGELLVGSLTGIDPEQARARGGQLDPSTIGRYVRLAGEDPVHVVNDFVTGELEPDPAEWLERPITGGDEARLRALSVRRRGSEPVVLLMDPPFPRFAGDQRPADPERARALARELLQAWASDVPEGADEDAKLGLQPPRVLAEGAFPDGTSVRLLLGDEAPVASGSLPCVYARAGEKPGPLLVPQQAVASLASATPEWLALQRVVGERAPESLTKLVHREGERSLTLARSDDGSWSVSTVSSGIPVTRKLEAQDPRRERAVRALAGLAVRALDRNAGAHGLLAPGFTVHAEGKEPFDLAVAPADEGAFRWVRRADLPWALAIPPGAARELRDALAALADPR